MVGLDGPVAGVDEVGRGPLAGPVVAAAVVFGERIPEGLRDSKKLSERRREALAVEIRDAAVAYSVGRAEVDEIDSLNILNASLLAMRRAVLGLVIVPDGVLVDGNRLPELPIPALAIVGGDDRVPAISAAAILAKVTRDDEMRRLAGSYSQYGFERNKGYPTAEHLDALARLGPTPLHRRTFAPVQRALARRAGGRSGTVAPCPA